MWPRFVFGKPNLKKSTLKKTPTGVRQYTREDIQKIELIYSLVKEKGMTLEGARQTLKVKKDDEVRRLEVIHKLESIKKELNNLRESLDDIE